MKLTEEQRKALEGLRNSPGFQVLVDIHRETLMLQAIAMSKVNIRTEEGQRLIEEYQIYSKAREDFFKDTEKHLVGKVYQTYEYEE